MKQIQIPIVLLVAGLLAIGVCPYRLYGQVEREKRELVAKSNAFNRQFPQEKIYLHLDRSSYLTGEDIWFKAYLKNMSQPTANLYVELINEKEEVVYRCNSWAQQGLAYGDIHLGDTIRSGIYQMRAYTNWMRNFDETWFFRKDLVIWNKNDITQPPQLTEIKARSVDFQFMPEGGVFLAGVENRMAFKVTDRNGKGLDATGKVVDEAGTLVTTFRSGFKGMGSFVIRPQAGKTYKALATVAGNIDLEIALPVVAPAGVALKVDREDTNVIGIEVNTTGIEGPQRYWVIGRAEGNVCCEEEVIVKSGTGSVKLDKKRFPTGIVCFTLFDSGFLPLCERLVFVNHHDQISLRIEPHGLDFRPRSKVTLDIYATDRDSVPVLANLSLTAFHADAAYETETYPENILTRFLLSSELKGKVEEPGFYFRDDSLKTLVALDNLLLTHGYRYFDWKTVIQGAKPETRFEPEASIELKGKVYGGLFRRPLVNGEVTMITLKSLLRVKQQKTDSLGRFRFSGLYFNDTILVAIQALNKKGQRNTLVTLDKSSFTPPKTGILPSSYKYNAAYPRQVVTYIADYSDELYRRRWHLNDTIQLREVSVVSRLRNGDDGHYRPYLEAFAVLDVQNFDNGYGNILDAAYYQSGSVRSYCDAGASFFLDGILTDKKVLEKMPITNFSKVELVETAPVPGAGIGPGIFFYTKRDISRFERSQMMFDEKEAALGITPTSMVGYSVIRKFYSPDYDVVRQRNSNKADFRNTLFWNPVLKTDEDGETWVGFFNGDQTGEVKVVVEGVSKDGKLCRGEYRYNVTN